MNVNQVARFLKERYEGYKDFSIDDLCKLVILLKDKIITIVGESGLIGVGIYLTLCDDTHEIIECIDVRNPNVVKELYSQEGKNVHFIIVCGNGTKNAFKYMRMCIRQTIKIEGAKTVSWWNPTMTKLHKYKANGGILCQ